MANQSYGVEMDFPSNPALGDKFTSNSGTTYIFDGSTWTFSTDGNPLGANSGAGYNFYSKTTTLYYFATSAQVVYDLKVADSLGNTHTFDPSKPEPVDVLLNGSRLMQKGPRPSSPGDYTLNVANSTITLDQPVPTGSLITIDVFASTSQLSPVQVNIRRLEDADLKPDGVKTQFALHRQIDGVSVFVTTPEQLVLSVDGVLQKPGDDYTTAGSNVIFTNPPKATSSVWGEYFERPPQVPSRSVGPFVSAVSVLGVDQNLDMGTFHATVPAPRAGVAGDKDAVNKAWVEARIGRVLESKATAIDAQITAGATDEIDAVNKIVALLAPAPRRAPVEGDVLLVGADGTEKQNAFAGIYIFNGAKWVHAASVGTGGGVKVDYRPTAATPLPTKPGAGDVDFLQAKDDHQINVYTGTTWELSLGEQQIKAWIAAGSLFQSAIQDMTALGALPAPGAGNRGFYWTWTGPASTPVTPADFKNGGGFSGTLQVGDWVQSDGTKFIQIPSDLMSKLRWQAVGSFVTWTDTNFEVSTLVNYKGKLYRATSPIVVGDLPPDDPTSKWLDITPTHALSELTDTDLTTPPTHGDYLAWDGTSLKWSAKPGIPDGNLDGDTIAWDATSQIWNTIANHLGNEDNIFKGANPDGGTLVYDAANDAYEIRKLKFDQLADTDDLQGATDGQTPMWDDTRKVWVPGTPASALNSLTDVNLPTTPNDGEGLLWNKAQNRWTAGSVAANLSTLADVDVKTTPQANGDYLVWDAAKNRWVPHQENQIDEWDAATKYNKGDIVISNGGLWRARQAGLLPEPTRKNGAGYLLIRMTGYNSEELFQVTSVSNAPPDATTDVSMAVSHKFHLEYHDDSNWKVYAYNKNTFAWSELAASVKVCWRSLGEPPDPDRPNQITLWIKTLKTYKTAPVPAGFEWEHFRVATSLAALEDVRLVDEIPGQTLVLAKDGRWIAGSAPAHIPEWSSSSTTYNIGDVTHFEGRFWRATRPGSDLAKPEMKFGAAAVIYDNSGQHVLVVRNVSATALTTPPIGLLDSYLRYVSDSDWDFYTAHINAATRALEWQAVTGAKSIWRHVALPSPATPPYAVLWIYALPGSSTAPIAGQTDWTPIILGDFLVSLADVQAATAQAGDTLVSDGKGKWLAQAPAPSGYTKSEIDGKLTALVTGIEHEESVLSITNTPPTSPNNEDVVIVGTVPTGAFAGHNNALARWDATIKDASGNPAPTWVFESPRTNEAHLVEDQDSIWHWNGTAWSKIANAAAGASGSGDAGIGEIVAWPLDTVPDGYIECMGQVVAVSSYPALYGVIGNKYNAGTAADGSTTFALPDLRGYFLRGAGTNLNGTLGGAVSSFHGDSTKRPNTAFTTDNPGTHHHDMPHSSYGATGGGVSMLYSGDNVPWSKISGEGGAHTHSITGGGDTETAPKHFSVKWVIRWKAIGQGARGPKGEPGVNGTNGANGLNGGVNVYADNAHFPTTKSAGQAYFAQDTKQLYIVETDGAATATDLKVLDQHTLRGDLTLGANAATAQEIILIKGLAASNESVYVDISNANTSTERANFALHLFANSASGNAPMAPIHITAGSSNFEYFRFFWKDNTDGYCLAAKVFASNNGTIFHVALRFPNALDSGVTLDGNTVNSNTGGTKVDAQHKYPSDTMSNGSLPTISRFTNTGAANTSTHGIWQWAVPDNAIYEMFAEFKSTDMDMRVGIAFMEADGTVMTVGSGSEVITGKCFSTWAASGNGNAAFESILPQVFDQTWDKLYHFMRTMPHAGNDSDKVLRQFPGTIYMTIDNTGSQSRITVKTLAKRVSGNLNIGNEFDLMTLVGKKVGKYSMVNTDGVGGNITSKGWIKTTQLS